MIREEPEFFPFCFIHQVARVPEGEFHIVFGHVIGVGIVDCRAAVFIRAFDEEAGELFPVRFPGKPAFPVTGGLQQHSFHLCCYRDARDVQHAFQGIRHIRRDMDFTKTDIPAFTLFISVRRAHPGIPGA